MELRTKKDLHTFQVKAIGRGLRWPSSMFLLDVGLGKTVVALTVIDELLDRFEIKGALVVSSKRIVQTVWRQEAAKWRHTKHLTFSEVRSQGKAVRDREVALDRRADIYLTNYEQFADLVWDNLEPHWQKTDRPLPFDMIVFDEVSKMSNPEALRCNALKDLLKWGDITRRMGLTATPATNGLMRLFGEYLVLDDGEHLGRSQEAFKFAYFTQNVYAHAWQPDEGAMNKIFRRVRHMTYAVQNKLDVPDVVRRIIPVELDLAGREAYDQMEDQFFVELHDGETVEAFNAASKTNKCLQAANGAMYVEPSGAPEVPVAGRNTVRRYTEVHNGKLEALEELLDELQGHPVLVCYPYRMDRARIAVTFRKKYKVKDIHDYKDAALAVSHMRDGTLDVLTGHPASMAHGIDGLQDNCCHIVWFGLVWDLELFEQAIGRLHRQGQKQTVVVHMILATDTLDYAVLTALEGKSATQMEFLQILRDYSKRKDNESDTTDTITSNPDGADLGGLLPVGV